MNRISTKACHKLISFIMVLTILMSCFASLFADGDVTATATQVGNWEQTNGRLYQFDVIVTNNGNTTAENWSVSFTVPSGAVLETCWWGVTASISGTTITITSSGRSIPSGQNVDVSYQIFVPNATTPTPTTPAPTTPAPTTPAPQNPTNPPAPVETAPTTVKPTATPTPTPVGETDISETTVDPTLPSDPTSGTPVQGDDWLHTDGSQIVDQNGTAVWLTGVNWFGYNTGTNIFDGCWSCNMDSALDAIADHGFNLLRIPMSAELVLQWKNGTYPEANFNQATNSELVGMNSLEIFDYALSICEQNGLKVMLDIHCAKTDSMGHMANLWYTDDFSVDQYYEALEFLADRYKNNDTVIAFDLKNEPHGKQNENGAIWNDSEDENNWKHVAEVAGNKVLDINPNVLIMIEGIEIYPKDISTNGDYSSQNADDYYFNWWGGNLRGVADYPIDFGSEERNQQIVYSPHDYGPTVYQQPWFQEGFTYESLKTDCWNDNWLFIEEENIAPLLIGEWGGFMSEPNLTWMTYMRQLIAEYHLNHTFWCFNSNSGDTGGLVLDDFTTWDEEKYAFVKEVLWQENGRFVGLDHAVALGANGMTLSEYSGLVVAPIVPPVEEGDAGTTTTTTPTPSPVTEVAGVHRELATSSKSKGPGSGVVVLLVIVGLLFVLVAGLSFIYITRPDTWKMLLSKVGLEKSALARRPNEWKAVRAESSATKNAPPVAYPTRSNIAPVARPIARPDAPTRSRGVASAHNTSASTSLSPTTAHATSTATATMVRPEASTKTHVDTEIKNTNATMITTPKAATATSASTRPGTVHIDTDKPTTTAPTTNPRQLRRPSRPNMSISKEEEAKRLAEQAAKAKTETTTATTATVATMPTAPAAKINPDKPATTTPTANPRQLRRPSRPNMSISKEEEAKRLAEQAAKAKTETTTATTATVATMPTAPAAKINPDKPATTTPTANPRQLRRPSRPNMSISKEEEERRRAKWLEEQDRRKQK
ncbi:MAG TPA: cellulase family glycosylhydrolase [Bacillota bacterium]|nr:cellulase family glycosylhydrolase [Bacillota bacterium]